MPSTKHFLPSMLPRVSIARLAITCLLSLLALTGTAYASSPQAFDARYHLAVDGWPDATIKHRVSREGGHWLSEMHSSVAIAGGNESARFIEDGDQLRALSYRSNYSMLGVGKSYQLNRDQLAQKPDRQTALISLSLQVQEDRCENDCTVRFVDYKGRDEILDWRRVDDISVQVDGQMVQAPTIELQDPEKTDRHMVMSFHPEIPGLLLRLDFYKHGEQVSQLSLSRLQL